MVQTFHQSTLAWNVHEKSSNILIYATWSKVRKRFYKSKIESSVCPKSLRKTAGGDGESAHALLNSCVTHLV